MPGVALASGVVEIGWGGPGSGGSAQVGSAIVGTSTVGLTAWEQTFEGAHDNITADVQAVRITRGRADPLAVLSAGTCTISGRDPVGKYNPKNSGSVLDGDLLPLRMGRVTRTFQTNDYIRFVGFIRSIEWRPSGRGGDFTIELVDLFVWLERFWPTIASTGPTTTGAALGLILDAVGWVDPAQRALDTGDTISDFSADGTKTALTLIEELLIAERGFFYISPSCVATFKDRHARAKSVSAGSITDLMNEVAPGTSLDNVKNRAVVTKTGGAAKTSTDSASIFSYGDRGFDPIETPYLPDDNGAQALADWLVATTKDPTAPLWKLTVSNRDTNAYALMLAADLVTRITVAEAQGGTDDDFFIEGYDETMDLDAGLHEWVLTLTERPAVQDFIIGQSEVGMGDVLGY